MDIQCLLWFQQFREWTGNVLDGFFLFISELGTGVLPVFIAITIYWCFHKGVGLTLLFSCNLSDLINGFFKLIFCAYRPWIRSDALKPVPGALEDATGYSFPSGHSCKAGSFYGSCARLSWKSKRWLSWLFIALALLVMLSRLYLGVHTPQDVLVGGALGVLLVFAAQFLLRWAEGGKNRDLIITGAGILFAAVSLVFISLKPYPMDMTAEGLPLVDPIKMQKDYFMAAGVTIGMLLGWVLERRVVRFDAACSWPKKAFRLLSGVLLAFLLLYTVVRHALQDALGVNIGAFLGAMLAIFYAVGVHPMVFGWAERLFQKKVQ